METEIHVKYTLDNSRPVKRFRCPACGKKELKLYIDPEGNYLADHVGRCNREVKCGYHYRPREYFSDNPDQNLMDLPKTSIIAHKPFSAIPYDMFQRSLNADLENNLLSFLENIAGRDKADAARHRFKIGHSKHWSGATALWYIDEKDRVRAGKVMLFDKLTGKRVKKPFNHIDWVHSILLKKGLLKEFNLNQCLFGLHQITNFNVTNIGIVESEKTAILSSIYLPSLTWMATGGLAMLNSERLSPIKKYPIVLYPDLGAFERWKEKADDLTSKGFKVVISDLLEKAPFVSASDHENGFDIGDYLIRINTLNEQKDLMGNPVDPEKGYPTTWL